MDPNKYVAVEILMGGKKSLQIMQYKYLPKGARRIGSTKAGQPLFRLQGTYKCL